VEHTASLRLIPEHGRLAPCRHGRDRGGLAGGAGRTPTGPTALLLSRQNLPYRARGASLADIARGGYVLAEPAEVGLTKAQAVIIATGSRGRSSRCKRRPSSRAQDIARARRDPCPAPPSSTGRTPPTRARCCRPGVPRVAVEAGVTDGWWKYVG
jgi:transketolase